MAAVSMSVMEVRVVRMAVRQRRVPVNVCVRRALWVTWAVLVLVVSVVRMTMLVLQGFMGMSMFVPLHQVQGHAGDHKRRRRQQLHGGRLGEHGDGQSCAEEGGH